MSTPVYLALGSNIGDRLDNLRRAVQLLQDQEPIEVEAKSKIYRTQSVEGGGETDFLNAALRVRTSLSPLELLKLIRNIEETLGRPQPPRHGPRAIDIDLLIFGDERMESAVLTLPHPRMHYRAFVLKPLLDVLEGGWVEETDLSWD
jgi:2-amino-4-hydroxy-6-hydroxymethyldihydropteridine diphosphokinase